MKEATGPGDIPRELLKLVLENERDLPPRTFNPREYYEIRANKQRQRQPHGSYLKDNAQLCKSQEGRRKMKLTSGRFRVLSLARFFEIPHRIV